DGDSLRLRGAVEVLAGDAVTVVERLLAERARDVEENAAAHHFVLGLLDAALLRAGRGYFATVVAVPHLVFVEDVPESVPLCSALQRHGHHVIGGTDAALVEHAGIGVGAGADHGVDRVGAAHRGVIALGALRTGVVEVERQRDDLAFAHEPWRRDEVLGTGIVERADLVVRTPLSPVLVFLGRVAKILTCDFLGWHGISFMWERAKRSLLARRRWRWLYCAARSGDDSINEKNKGGRRDGRCPYSRIHFRADLHSGRRQRVLRGDLSRTAGPIGRAVRAWRPDGRDRTHRCAEIVGGQGAAGLHRKHARRRRQHRRGRRGTHSARRLHDARGEYRLHGQSEHVCEGPV